MNKITNKLVLTEDKFMLGLHLKHHEFTYSVCGSFTKHRTWIQKIREIGNLRHWKRNELDKILFCSWCSIFW